MHILCISDDPMLSLTRSELLRVAHHSVVECSSATAWQTFLNGDFDAVVLCASLPLAQQIALVHRMSKHSPSLLIVRCEQDDLGDTANVVHVPHADPVALLEAVIHPPKWRGPSGYQTQPSLQ
jgi:DNA-binding response OmpR family regulator